MESRRVRRKGAPMSCLSGCVCILRGDPDTYQLRVGGRIFRFEFSDLFGPLVVGKRDQEIKQPGEKSSFWPAVTLWKRQGKRIRDGFCLWTPEPVEILQHLGGRNYKIVGETPQEDCW